MRTILLALCVCLAPALAGAQGYDRGGSGYERGAQAWGQPGPGGRMQQYAPAPLTPDQILRRGIDRLTGFLIGAGNPGPEELRIFLELEVAPHFDFEYMAQWAAGPLYRRLTREQHQRLARKLENMFLDALARNLGTYARPLPRIEVYPARAGHSGNEATVDARVITDAGIMVHLEFKYYWSEGGWKIYDVSANGASAVAFYRGYFTSLIRRHGPEKALE